MSSQFFKSGGGSTKKFERAHRTANQYVHAKMGAMLDELEKELTDDAKNIKWDRDIVNTRIGMALALAYAHGALDKTNNAELKIR